MRFTFSTPEPTHGIRVIPTIPDFELGRIEGLNGVGKTLAIHLLEICSGQQPYTTRPHAWRTLCEYLGPAEILIEGLRPPLGSSDDAVHSLRFAFDWRSRSNESPPGDISADLFDEIILDGARVEDMKEVRRWLGVVRLAGNQSLTDTIAGIVSYDLALINASANLVHDRQEHADSVISALLAEFPIELAQRALASSEQLDSVFKERSELEQEREQLATRLANLERAESALAAVSEVSSNSDALSSEIDSLAEQIEEAQERGEKAEKELQAAHETARLSDEAQKQLEDAEALFDKRLKSLRRVDKEVEKKAATTSIAADNDIVDEAVRRNQQSRVKVAADQADLKDLFALRDLLDSLIRALAPAASSGLRGRAVATVGADTLTVGDLLDSVRGRRERLAEDSPAVEELEQRAAKLDAEQTRLEELQGLLKKRAKKRGELQEAEKALEELEPSESGSDAVAEKSAARAAAQRIEMELQAALGAAQRQLAQLGGGVSVEDLQAEVERHLNEADTTREQLPEDLSIARRNLVALDDQLDSATAKRDELASQVLRMERLLADQARSLQADNGHARLRGILGDRMPNPDLDCKELAESWIAIHAAGDQAVRAFQSARTDLDRLSKLINELVRTVEKGGRPAPELDAVRRYYQERMLDQFSQPELLDALFDSGELTRVDLAASEIVWRTATGEPRVRPFEAFSSGERAFAYIQAQLASIGGLDASNKLVVVDEFGAFLSRDRLMRLQEVVQQQLETGAVTQALVILPMSREEDVEASGTAGYIAGDFSELTTA